MWRMCGADCVMNVRGCMGTTVGSNLYGRLFSGVPSGEAPEFCIRDGAD
jgi:hypothetical protein